MDADGYGYRSTERGVGRLLEDIRTLSPVGIARVAWGWDEHERNALGKFHEAEKAALQVIERANLGPEWEKIRRDILELTERGPSLVSWKAEHGQLGHKAERAALGAALALLARDQLDHAHFVTLVRPMAEGLPWLLPESAPKPRL
jgi:hypothetical protein